VTRFREELNGLRWKGESHCGYQRSIECRVFEAPSELVDKEDHERLFADTR